MNFEFSFNDNSWSGVANLEFVPETRVAMRLSGTTKIALEEYDDFVRVGHFLAASKQMHQLFLVVDKSTKWADLELGFGAGFTAATDHRVIKLIVPRNL
ncbi:MAG: hypothetical protein ABSF94_10580 [Steroidobacteraceae bacterium]|jgi:hypothetical protein